MLSYKQTKRENVENVLNRFAEIEELLACDV